jgi:hypothetical protein
MGPLQQRARLTHPHATPTTSEAMDLSVYASPSATTAPTSPRPKGHIWSTRLSSWVVPITRKPGRRPSPDHIHCSEPPCWVLIEPLTPAEPDDPAGRGR